MTSCHVRVTVFTSLQRAQTGGLAATPGRCSRGASRGMAPASDPEPRWGAPRTAAVTVVLRARGVARATSWSTGASAEMPSRSFHRTGHVRTQFSAFFQDPVVAWAPVGAVEQHVPDGGSPAVPPVPLVPPVPPVTTFQASVASCAPLGRSPVSRPRAQRQRSRRTRGFAVIQPLQCK